MTQRLLSVCLVLAAIFGAFKIPARYLSGKASFGKPRSIAKPALIWALLAGQAGAQTVVSARLTDPTDRYPHRVMGTIAEHTTLEVVFDDGARHRLTHQPGMVFEDIAPRVVDLDGDGRPEVLTVESHDDKGARFVLYGIKPDGQFGLRGAGPFIGQRFRWMGVIGAADLTGDGQMEIALIDRPHLAKVLRIYRVEGLETARVTTTEIARFEGVTNHRIGDSFLTGGIRTCGARPDLVLASAGWRSVIGLGFKDGQLTPQDLGPATPERFAAIMACTTP